MLNANQLASRIHDFVADRLSFADFEQWFREHSRDVHQWGDEDLNSLVFSIEDVLSKYHFEGLRSESLKRDLAGAVGSLANSPLAENRYGDPNLISIPKSNARISYSEAA